MPTEETTEPEPGVLDYESIEHEDERWEDDPAELPRRPRRRFLAPAPVALLAILMLACGFLAGVKVQKDQGASSGTSAAGAARLAASGGSASAFKRAAAGSGATGAPTGFPGAGAAGRGAVTGAGAGGGTGASLTSGEVSFVDGSTLYVADSAGNTVKVTAGAGAKITKTSTTAVHDIHPGETVTVTGAKGKSNSILASSIYVAEGSSSATSSSTTTSSSTGAGNGAAQSGAGG